MTNVSGMWRKLIVFGSPFFILIILGILLNATDPLKSGPASILLVFVLIYLLFFSAASVILRIVGLILSAVKPALRFNVRQGYYFLSVIALAPVLLIALNTLGQLDTLECILILLFVALGCFYVVRRTAK